MSLSSSAMAPRIGIVGCGAIGRAVLQAVAEGRLRVPVAGVTSRDAAKARAFLDTLPEPFPYLEREALIGAADLLIEAAGQAVVPDLVRDAIAAGKDVMVISVGALLDRQDLLEDARRAGCRVLIPSGAIAGLDGIKSASVGQVDSVTITTRKPPAGLAGAPHLEAHGISLDGLREPLEVFSGNAREACRGFPANVNVTAAVSLAGIGADRTQVRILAVPGLARNCHEVEVLGEFGALRISLENTPSENPRTGRLTAFSILRAIQDAADPVRVGN